MGVKDLWQLLSPIGRRVSIESLEGKTLAIDMSIWITQFIKAMRDDDGKMVKNAHIIGTVRRILRLLFHRIKPIFVFDGETPALKRRIVQSRRKATERSESNRIAAVQRLILAQLKQQKKHMMQGSPGVTTAKIPEPSSFAKGFTTVESSNTPKDEIDLILDNPLIPSSSSAASQYIQLAPVENEINWAAVSSQEIGLPSTGKTLEEDDESEEDSEVWNLPDDHKQLDIEVLSSLPPQIRKRIIEEARRKERMRSRASYIPVAADPTLYSQTQLTNFLKTSQLNRRFEDARKLVEGSNSKEGIKIAAEGNKRYLFVDKDKALIKQKHKVRGGFGSDDSSSSGEDENDDSSDNMEWLKDATLEIEPTETSKPGSSHVPKNLLKSNSSMANYPVLYKEESKNHEVATSAHVAKALDAPFASSKAIPNFPTKMMNRDRDLKIGIERDITSNERLTIDMNKEAQSLITANETASGAADSSWLQDCEHVDRISGFYADFHNSDSEAHIVNDSGDEETGSDNSDDAEDEDPFKDVVWESADALAPFETMNQTDDGKCPLVSDTMVCLSSSPHILSSKMFSDAGESDSIISNVRSLYNSADSYQQQQQQQQQFSQQSNQSRKPVTNKTADALDRAVATASSMADWAGRVVKKVLKDHLNESSPPAAIAAAAAAAVANLPIASTSSTYKSQAAGTIAKANELVKSFIIEEVKSTEKRERESSSQENSNRTSQLPMSPAAVATESTWRDDFNVSSKDVAKVEIIEENEFVNAAYEKPYIDWTQRTRLDIREDDNDDLEIAESRRKIASSARDTERMTEEMKQDVMELIVAFDLPFLVAPFEAEAQCAVLEELGLVDGVITEDSDSLLFGAKTIYKNIFNDKKFVEVYLAEDARREMGLSREDMIALAYFLGSDYTEGVNGVGIVNAMEIIHTFSTRVEDGGPLQGLSKFKHWLDGYDFAKEVLESLNTSSKSKSDDGAETAVADGSSEALTAEQKLINFEKKHKTGRAKWSVPNNFPDPKVLQEYLHPGANRSVEPFRIGFISRSKVRGYCKQTLGWTDAQMDLQIDPVLQRFSERTTQTRIDSHFVSYHDDNRFAKIASDRLRSAVVQITGKRTNLALPAPKERKGKQSKKDGNIREEVEKYESAS